ncbi:enoyl-CoA hydratase-related protein [Dyadobacter chenwenxiniae]|uniref:Enoyl-CoA hydratase-related protein n=1 Tax=Dyadobacter chenwenxiniae TaxID=2906456 RepID=A0A9X1PJV5_9BACT|nr:enoyl-CoA hydratase-related protein [Dyadobacter chenwenxiniae]MCF0061519.1 enoyl-CoA hydratase-related protein [Dyadobacter chenwenxiniae]UON81342.1 enoyl-CoA hydratase-related protein [Dyadobacter chenwenxiniae]
MRFYTEEDVQDFGSVKFLYIKTSLSNHIFTITLSRPEKRNAFTPTMAEEIIFALAYANYNNKVRCLIINAEGSVFCAGADLNAFHDTSANTKNSTLPAIREEAKLGDAFNEVYKPTIAQVEGPVLAGGFLIICGCTFVFSVNDAVFSLPEVKRGIWPMQVMASLSRVISARKILEMCITGKSYNAEEALELGLLTHITETESIKNEVQTMAAQIAQNAPYAIQQGMKAFQKLKQIPESEKHSFLKAELDQILASEDAKEGVQAFKEKRSPNWKGR